MLTSSGVESTTSAMGDSYVARKPKMDEFAARIEYPEGASGLAVAVGDKIVAVDLFDSPATCGKVWQRLLSGYIMGSMDAAPATEQVTEPAVEGTLTTLRNSSWEQVRPVGDGEEYRVKSEDGSQASALAFGDSLVHGSLLTGA